MRGFARRVLLLWLIASWSATGWVLSQNPFARPVIERTAAEARVAFGRAMALKVTPDWLLPRLADAVAAERSDDIALYRDLAAEHAIPVPPDLDARVDAVLADHAGWAATAADCAACAYDITRCPTLAMIGTCAIPVEMTPLGDLNALRRAGVAWASSDEVDGLEASLALVGLAATGLVAVSGGTSAGAKFGATLLRLARRTGALPPRLARSLGEAASGVIRWDRLSAVLTRAAPLDTAVDAARWSRLVAVAADAGRLRANTSSAEALVLLREAETIDDVARLARVSDIAGGETRKVMRVLGADAFRLLTRLSNLSLAAIGLVALVAAQLASLLLGALRLLLRRAVRGPKRHGPRRPVA